MKKAMIFAALLLAQCIVKAENTKQFYLSKDAWTCSSPGWLDDKASYKQNSSKCVPVGEIAIAPIRVFPVEVQSPRLFFCERLDSDIIKSIQCQYVLIKHVIGENNQPASADQLRSATGNLFQRLVPQSAKQ